MARLVLCMSPFPPPRSRCPCRLFLIGRRRESGICLGPEAVVSPTHLNAPARCTYVHQTEARRRVLALLLPAVQKGARRAAGVDKELVHVLKGIEAVSAPPAQDIDVEPVGLCEEQVGLAGDEGEAFEEADADAAVRHDLRQGQRGGLDVVAALDNLEVGRNGPQVVVRVLVRQVAQAERLADLAGREELLELSEGVSLCRASVVGKRATSSREAPWAGCPARDRGCAGPR